MTKSPEGVLLPRVSVLQNEQPLLPTPDVNPLGLECYGVIDAHIDIPNFRYDEYQPPMEFSDIYATKEYVTECGQEQTIEGLLIGADITEHTLAEHLGYKYLDQLEAMTRDEQSLERPAITGRTLARKATTLHDDQLDIKDPDYYYHRSMTDALETTQRYFSEIAERHPDLRMLMLVGSYEDTTFVTYYYYSGGQEKLAEQAKRAWESTNRFFEGLRDAHHIFGSIPKTVDIVIIPESQADADPQTQGVVYTPLFDDATELFDCTALAYVDQEGPTPSASVLLIPSAKESMKLTSLTRDERAAKHIRSSWDYNVYLSGRHEATHLVHDLFGSSSVFLAEGIAQLMENPDLPSSRVHKHVNTSILDIDRILDFADADRSDEAIYTYSEHELFTFSRSLMCFLYDYSQRDDNKLGEFMRSVSGDDRVPIRQALQNVYNLDESSLRTHWLEAIEAAKRH